MQIMIHLNEEWKQGPLTARIEELSKPQIYFASTLYDFYDARQEIQTTNFIRALMHENFQVYGKAIINFQNVVYKLRFLLVY